jgi:polynucleotide 5'-hydroxyl-kinase GRC3/NOL9
MWRTVANHVLSLRNLQEPLVVMVAGGTDTGKSTFCTFLANRAIADGVIPSIVDGDIGQSDLAPPSVIGAAALDHQISDLRDISGTVFEFVGSTSPHRLEYFVSQRLASIVTRSCSAGRLCIVNTDGYVDNGGVAYKKMIATEIQPGIIVLLGKKPILQDSLAAGPWEIVRAKASPSAQKSRRVREWRRRDQFARYLGSGRRVVDLADITFVYLGASYSFSELRSVAMPRFQPENMKRMFVGLGSGQNVAGFGVIAEISRERLAVLTDIESFDTIYASDIRLA